MSRQSKYPWDEWLDGRAHTLHRHEDFGAEVSIRAMQVQVRQQAVKRGLDLRVRVVDDDTISFALPKQPLLTPHGWDNVLHGPSPARLQAGGVPLDIWVKDIVDAFKRHGMPYRLEYDSITDEIVLHTESDD